MDAAGRPVEPVAAFFRDLQAAGRSASTLRSYGLDLLRWFRFLWAVEAVWDRATRAEARDFSRWPQLVGKPSRPHWRKPHEPAVGSTTGQTGEAYAPSVRAHSETVLRTFYDFHREAETGPIVNPFPLDRPAGSGGHTPIATRWSRCATNGSGGIGRPWRVKYRV